MVGYNRIKQQVDVLNTDSTFYIMERFDGFKSLISGEKLLWGIKHARDNQQAVVANTKLVSTKYMDGTKQSEHAVISDKDEIKKSTYIPNIRGIEKYIDNYGNELFKYTMSHNYNSSFFESDSNSIVEKTKMTKQEFDSLIPKMNMIGIPTMLVELNTIASIQDNMIKIYTKQKSIELNQ
jgi:hypothetical protein